MEWKKMHLQSRLHVISAAILLAGLGGSILIYFMVPEEPDNMMIYEYEQSKAYKHDLELYGGKLNVLLSDFMQWFDSLWHGKPLSFTIAFISAFVSGVIFLSAKLFPPDEGDSGPPDDAGANK